LSKKGGETVDTQLIGERIKEARLMKSLTLDDIAGEIGVAKSTIQRYENGLIRNPKIPVLDAIANALGVNPAWLAGRNVPREIPLKSVQYPQVMEIGTQTFPLFSGIACGEPMLMDDTVETYISITTRIRADFVLRAVGSSMEPGIHDGDLVFIRSQPAVENGEVAAVAIEDEATLKRVYWYPEKEMLILRPDNPQYKERYLYGDEAETVRILGRAVALQRDVL
jgi:repressor LexA